MMENNELGTRGLSYGTPLAEQLIAERVRRHEEKAYGSTRRYEPTDLRRTAINQLAAEGNLKTEGEVDSGDRYLGESLQRELANKRHGRDPTLLDSAKAEAKRRNITLSEVMNEKALRGEVT